MIQFNLLPDIKLDYIKAKRGKRLVIGIAMLAGVASLSIFVILFLAVNVAQNKNLSDLSKDIKSQTAILKKDPDLDKILTIQNQLNSLTALHDKKPVISRLFVYLPQITPSQATISSVSVSFTDKTVGFQGSADSIPTVNKFADTLKFAAYRTASGKEGKPFSDVVTQLSGSDKSASYSLSMTIDPILFDSSEQVTLIIPKIITTRSETEKPTALFDTPAKDNK